MQTANVRHNTVVHVIELTVILKTRKENTTLNYIRLHKATQ